MKWTNLDKFNLKETIDGGTTVPADPPHVYSYASLTCAQNVTNGNLQNDSPPAYTNANFKCTQNVTNGNLHHLTQSVLCLIN